MSGYKFVEIQSTFDLQSNAVDIVRGNMLKVNLSTLNLGVSPKLKRYNFLFAGPSLPDRVSKTPKVQS